MATQSSTAVFLGAGASCDFGYHLTSEILPHIISTWGRKGTLFEGLNDDESDAVDRRELQRYLTGLLPGLRSIKREKLPLITEVFSLVDLAVLQGSAFVPRIAISKMQRFRDLLKQSIYDVLVDVWLNRPTGKRQKRSLAADNRLKRRFVGWLASHLEVGVVSTNYDTVVEDALFDHKYGRKPQRLFQSVDFGFECRDPFRDAFYPRPKNPRYRLYKLHGSLNRLRCSLCESVYVNIFGPIAFHALRQTIDANNTCYCKHAPLEMQIVAPSLVREMRDSSLSQTWKHALEWLRRSTDWYLIGYSLPPEDLAIRDLLLRAYHARKKPPQVTVVQWDEKPRANFELLFPKCRYITGGLAKFLSSADA